jgi:UDP-glucose 4-epimerase
LDSIDVPLIEGTVLNEDVLSRVARGKDTIVHLAALPSVPRSIADPLATHHANATGTLQVLRAGRDFECHVVLASSSSVYGRNPALPKSEMLRPEPMSPYAVSKLAAEHYALAFAECYGMDVLPFRFFNVFGPRQAPNHAYAAVVPNFLAAALGGRPIPIDGDGSQSRDFTFVGSVVSILCEAISRRNTCGNAVNLAFGGRTTLMELVKEIEQLLGSGLQVEFRPPRTGDVSHSQADSQLLATLFPGVRPTPLTKGLALTLEWMKTVI